MKSPFALKIGPPDDPGPARPGSSIGHHGTGPFDNQITWGTSIAHWVGILSEFERSSTISFTTHALVPRTSGWSERSRE